MKKLFLPILIGLLSAVAALAQTFTVTPSTATYSTAGGQIAFNVALSYPADVTAVSLIVRVPAGWEYVSTYGTNLPSVAPLLGDTAEFGFTYITVPTSPAAFSFMLKNASGLTGNQTLAISGDYRSASTNGSQPLTGSNVVLTATVTSTAPTFVIQPANVSIASGQNATFTASATGSPAPALKWQRSTDNGATWSDLTNTAPFSGVGTGTLTVTGVTIAQSGHRFRAIASNGVSPDATSNAATLSIPFAPVISAHPQSQSVSTGGTLTLNVIASGNPAPTYQWRKGVTVLTNGGRISGATSATLVISNVQAGDEGGYNVVVSNGTAPDATSNTATITLVAAGFSATHALVGLQGYQPGTTVTVTNTLNYTGELAALSWSVLLPSGWSFASAVNAGNPSTSPVAGDLNVIDWVWATPPASGSTFTYTLNVPSNATGNQALTAFVELTVGEQPITLLASPDPLAVNALLYHSADTNSNFKIDVGELTRVITLYNTRYTTPEGRSRTGAYRVVPVSVSAPDGFAPDTSRDLTTPVTLSRYHSADTNGNGRIDVGELTRVVTLYNTRYTTPEGRTRTGAYKVAPVSPTSPDGFAPDTTRAP